MKNKRGWVDSIGRIFFVLAFLYLFTLFQYEVEALYNAINISHILMLVWIGYIVWLIVFGASALGKILDGRRAKS